MLDVNYDGVAVLLAGTAVRAHQIKQEQRDRLPDIAEAHVWTPAMASKDGLRVGRIYLARGCGFDPYTGTGRRAFITALRCAQRTPNSDRQVWELLPDGEARPFDLPGHGG